MQKRAVRSVLQAAHLDRTNHLALASTTLKYLDLLCAEQQWERLKDTLFVGYKQIRMGLYERNELDDDDNECFLNFGLFGSY